MEASGQAGEACRWRAAWERARSAHTFGEPIITRSRASSRANRETSWTKYTKVLHSRPVKKVTGKMGQLLDSIAACLILRFIQGMVYHEPALRGPGTAPLTIARARRTPQPHALLVTRHYRHYTGTPAQAQLPGRIEEHTRMHLIPSGKAI